MESRFLICMSLVNVPYDLSLQEDFAVSGLLLLQPRAKAYAEQIFDEPAIPQAASKRSDTHCTCTVSLLCEAWCGSEGSKIARKTSCSTCTETVSLGCECACASANCFES